VLSKHVASIDTTNKKFAVVDGNTYVDFNIINHDGINFTRK
jgi:hypothetical protein